MICTYDLRNASCNCSIRILGVAMLVCNKLLLRWKVYACIAGIAYRRICDHEAHFACPDHSKTLDYLCRACTPYDAVVHNNHMLAADHFPYRYYALVYLDPVTLVWLNKTAH